MFPAEQIHVVTSDQMRTERDFALRGVFTHLGLEEKRFPWEREASTAYRTADRRSVPPTLLRLRNSRGVAAVVDHLPTGLRRRVRGAVEQELEPASVSEETRRYLVDRIADDTRRLATELCPDLARFVVDWSTWSEGD